MGRAVELLRLWGKGSPVVEKWIRLYIHNRNLYATGNGHFGFFRLLVNPQAFIVWWLFVRSLVPEFPLVLFIACVPVIILIRIGSCWALGFWWDRNNFYDREKDWDNKRNPVMKEVSARLLDSKGIQ